MVQTQEMLGNLRVRTLGIHQEGNRNLIVAQVEV